MVEQQTMDFQASKPFVLGAKSSISAADLGLVFNLYLPFLGPKAYALYQFLVEEEAGASGMEAGALASTADGRASFPDHYLILDSLSMSAPDLVRAKQALEAVSLLKSYKGVLMGKETYRYVLNRPLSAADFFKEDLLSGLLYHYVGEDRYLALAKRYQGRTGQPLNDEKDQSASFLKVFGMPENNQKPQVQVEDDSPIIKSEDWDKVNFDWAGMCELVHGTTKDNLEQERDFIMAQQVLYGLNESEMATAVTRSINLDDHELNKQGFLSYLSQHWNSQRRTEQMADMKKEATGPAEQGSAKQEATAAAKQPVTTNNPEVNKALKRLYDAANSLSPIDFIGQIKEQNRGYVTNGEARILNDLIDHKTLPVPAINILVYQVLVNMDQADLKRSLVDAIANSWSKAGVKSAEDAVAAIKAHKEKSAQGKQQNAYAPRRNNWSNRAQKQEPAFAKNEQKQDNVDQQAVKQALDMMKKYKTKD